MSEFFKQPVELTQVPEWATLNGQLIAGTRLKNQIIKKEQQLKQKTKKKQVTEQEKYVKQAKNLHKNPC